MRHYARVAADSGARLLIATGAAAADVAELPPLVRWLLEDAAEILVVTPLLVSRLDWYSDDFPRAQHAADERLAAGLGHLETLAPNAEPRGEVGDEAPLTAFADAIAKFRPEHILIALRTADHAAWQERRLLDSIRHRFHIPMTVFEFTRHGHVPFPVPD